MNLKVRFVLVLPLCFVIVAGCSKTGSGQKATLIGKMTYKGEPVTGGMMTVNTKDEGAFSFGLNPDGTFNKSDLPVGENLVVTVETESVNPNKPTYGGPKHKDTKDSTPEGAPVQQGAYVKIPGKYRDPAKSTLKVTLHKGENKQDFTLED